jgi:hypothetical protein
MQLNALHMRFGAIAAGILLMIGLAVCHGSPFGAPDAMVSIEFGADPDALAGLPVEIDGKLVGKLERIGQATRNAFPVEEGKHRVRLVAANLRCEPVEVNVKKGLKAYLIVEYDESSAIDKPSIALRM